MVQGGLPDASVADLFVIEESSQIIDGKYFHNCLEEVM